MKAAREKRLNSIRGLLGMGGEGALALKVLRRKKRALVFQDPKE